MRGYARSHCQDFDFRRKRRGIRMDQNHQQNNWRYIKNQRIAEISIITLG